MTRIKKLPHTEGTKQKIREAVLGRKHTEEAKAKMRVAALGRKHKPETIEKIRAARKAELAKTDADIAEECRLRNRAASFALSRARLKLLKLDKLAAVRIERLDVLDDLKQSHGRRRDRKILNVPGISNGVERG